MPDSEAFQVDLPDISTDQIDGMVDDIAENIGLMDQQEQMQCVEILLTFMVRIMRNTHGVEYTNATLDCLKDIE